eukprot:3931722-Rhodomonas_salina.1
MRRRTHHCAFSHRSRCPDSRNRRSAPPRVIASTMCSLTLVHIGRLRPPGTRRRGCTTPGSCRTRGREPGSARPGSTRGSTSSRCTSGRFPRTRADTRRCPRSGTR